MWTRKQTNVEWYPGFFLINLSHETLVNYYQTNYQLMENHNYALADLDMMIPWEREIYVTMLVEDMKQREEARNKL